MSESKSTRNIIPSVEKALDILTLLSNHSNPISFENLLDLTGSSRSSLFRLITTMEEKQFIEKDSSGWKISKQLYRIGLIELNKLDVKKEAKSEMEKLAARTGEYVQLGVLVNGQVMYIDHVKQEKPLTIYTELGSLLHVNLSAAGMMLICHLPDKDISEIIQKHGIQKQSPKSITDETQFKEYLQTCRKNGYALDDEMYATGIYCIAAPIYNYHGETVAAVGVSGLKTSFTGTDLKEKIQHTIQAAKNISAKLGYSP